MTHRSPSLPAFDLLTMRLFVAVCEERSLARAAVREHIALSALSRRISELEGALGLPLLLRHSRGVEPTGTGLAMLQHAHIILRDVGQMESDLADRMSGLRGTCSCWRTISGWTPDPSPGAKAGC